MIKNGDLPAMPLAYVVEYPTNIGYEKRDEVCFGLTKREQFAMAAMQGILSCDNSEFPNVAAVGAVAHADALLEELERTK